MIRTYKHGGHYTNPGKLEKIRAVAREYQVYYNRVAQRAINDLYLEGSLPKFLPVLGESKLSKRYRQTCGSQARATVSSWLSNIENRVSDVIRKSSLPPESKKRLFIVNSLHLWFAKSLNVANRRFPEDEAKLLRRIFKQVRGRYPHMNHPSMLLDRKVAQVEKSESREFDFWIKLSTLAFRQQIYLPMKTYEYFTSKEGIDKNAVQIIVKPDGIDYGLIKDKAPEPLEKKGVLGIDIGFVEILNTSSGNKYGLTLHSLLKKYDGLIQKQVKGRYRAELKHNSTKLESLYSKVRELIKNEVGRALNKLILTDRPEILVMEKLDNLVKNTRKDRRLSKSMRRLLINSGISQIKHRIRQKCEEYGIVLVEVNPAYTSQTCSSCGYVNSKNRRGKIFNCGYCSYTTDADYNGSVDIRQRRSLKEVDVFTPHRIVKEILETMFSRHHASDREAMPGRARVGPPSLAPSG